MCIRDSRYCSRPLSRRRNYYTSCCVLCHQRQQLIEAANGVAVLSQEGSHSNGSAKAGKGGKGKSSAAAAAAAATIVADSTTDTPNSATMAAIKMARWVVFVVSI